MDDDLTSAGANASGDAVGNDWAPEEPPWGSLLHNIYDRRAAGGWSVTRIAWDTAVALKAHEDALARLAAVSPDAASHFALLLADVEQEARRALGGWDQLRSGEAQALVRQAWPQVWDETIQADLGKWVKTVIGELQREGVARDLVERAIGRAVLELEITAYEFARPEFGEPDRWPNVRLDAYEPSRVAIECAREALDDVTAESAANMGTTSRAEAVAEGLAMLERYAELQREIVALDDGYDPDAAVHIGEEFLSTANALTRHLEEHYELLMDSDFSAALRKLHAHDPSDTVGSSGVGDGPAIVIMVVDEPIAEPAPTVFPPGDPSPGVDL